MIIEDAKKIEIVEDENKLKKDSKKTKKKSSTTANKKSKKIEKIDNVNVEKETETETDKSLSVEEETNIDNNIVKVNSIDTNTNIVDETFNDIENEKSKKTDDNITPEKIETNLNKSNNSIEGKIEELDIDAENSYQSLKNNKSSKSHFLVILLSFIFILLIIFGIIFAGFTFYNHSHNSIISNRVFINNIDVSGLTIDQAKEKLNEFYTDKLSNDITLVHDDYTTYIKTSEINLTYDIDSAVNYAYQYGKSGNIFADNYQVFSILLNGLNITPKSNIDEDSLTKILTNFSTELPDRLIESGYYIDGNNLIITKGKSGVVIDNNSTINNIKEKLNDLSYLTSVVNIETFNASPKEIDINKIYNDIHKEPVNAYYTTNPFVVYPSENGTDFAISLEEASNIVKTSDSESTIPLKSIAPSITTNMIGQEAFPDLLATFSTKYAASNTNRTTNLKLAANKINGTVLLPNQIFSYNTTVGERSIAAGYKEAAIYQNGEVVDGIGGGICQISTTLYNAALFANLEMVELYNHQFVPSYVTAGRDATVVYGVKDFKFKNTRKHAIKITCTVANGTATFQIWGVKEATEYDINVYATVNRTPTYIKSTTYRVLKLNNQTVKTEKISNSTYKVH